MKPIKERLAPRETAYKDRLGRISPYPNVITKASDRTEMRLLLNKGNSNPVNH